VQYVCENVMVAYRIAWNGNEQSVSATSKVLIIDRMEDKACGVTRRKL
jgi:hypothetical protein